MDNALLSTEDLRALLDATEGYIPRRLWEGAVRSNEATGGTTHPIPIDIRKSP